MSQDLNVPRTPYPRPSRRVEINTDKMRDARRRKNFSYTTLAGTIYGLGHDVSSARLGQIEQGKGSPSPELFPVLARALGLTEDELRRV